MTRHEEYMKQAAAQSDALEQAGKEAYSGNVIDMVNNPKHYCSNTGCVRFKL